MGRVQTGHRGSGWSSHQEELPVLYLKTVADLEAILRDPIKMISLVLACFAEADCRQERVP